MFSSALSSAHDFIWRYARLLDRRRFAYHFLDGPAEMVVSALKAYQNPDGGFGSALEPDKRVPSSQPVDVQMALNLLDEIGMLADPAVQQELILPACGFLASITTSEGGVPFALPDVRYYPHAPWWEVEDQPPANINPTAGIVGLLLKSGVAHPWLETAVPFCWSIIESSQAEDYHTIIPILTFLEHAPDRRRAGHEIERVLERIRKPGVVEYDTSAGGYVKMPLDWAPTPSSTCRPLFDDATLTHHLQALASRQQPDGGWPITWDPVSPAVEFEWRGIHTIDNLLTLRAYESQV